MRLSSSGSGHELSLKRPMASTVDVHDKSIIESRLLVNAIQRWRATAQANARAAPAAPNWKDRIECRSAR